MPEDSVFTMTRRQMYDEIWKLSVTGVANKYDLPYAHLMKMIKEADIPIPPSGYWTKLNYNKPVTKPELPEPAEEMISIYRIVPNARKKRGQTEREAEINATDTEVSSAMKVPALTEVKHSQNDPPPVIDESSEATQSLDKPESYEVYGKTYNVYNRETLYYEVWQEPVTEVAKKYGVSDVAIRKVCQSLDIPMPQVGYWAKFRAGKAVIQTPLPISDKPVRKTGARTGAEWSSQIVKETLAFLDEEERAIALSVATQIRIPDENAKMHPTIIAHRKAIMEWKKK